MHTHTPLSHLKLYTSSCPPNPKAVFVKRGWMTDWPSLTSAFSVSRTFCPLMSLWMTLCWWRWVRPCRQRHTVKERPPQQRSQVTVITICITWSARFWKGGVFEQEWELQGGSCVSDLFLTNAASISLISGFSCSRSRCSSRSIFHTSVSSIACLWLLLFCQENQLTNYSIYRKNTCLNSNYYRRYLRN